ncbi:hypothetical protein [Tetragenococcus halophilus]|uniref:Uncharacterized protein n=1 Tax=Tetragenococcus halophilus TaxID=51669 RepID=A0AB35HSP3_TETHA|nr:hypothetical protein [Tetragenococcus halophilus]MCF1601123.1 hypothetical protein [Tetragenococcus halophilus]MCO8292201.1 hypothetical protein [Tetragenococcus halophilus]MCO8296780.1 hypothetical protein [Tetragenococcus halophilus]MCO8299251.1 hypothetical protein [Tetragenococcus halophilus]GEQ38920.1 hypothetical protein TH3N_20460 [Tetragenococcus halophilus]
MKWFVLVVGIIFTLYFLKKVIDDVYFLKERGKIPHIILDVIALFYGLYSIVILYMS